MQSETSSRLPQPHLLRRSLQANGVFCSLSGISLLLAAGPVGSLLGLEAIGVLRVLGLILAIYGLNLLWLAARPRIPRNLVVAAVALDLLWVVASALLLVTGWVSFSPAGSWIVAIVADIVALFAILQYIGLRRVHSQTPAAR